MVRGDDGAPIAPALVSLTTADGVLSTRGGDPAPDICHIDQVRGDMQYVSDLDLGTTLVHVIDREADSVDHWRQWSVDGHLALVRGDDRRVLCQGKESSLVAVAEGFRQGDAFQDAGTARFHGRVARLYVAEAEVVLHRPGRRNVGQKKVDVPGAAVAVAAGRHRGPRHERTGAGPLAVADQRAGRAGRRGDDRAVVLLPLADRDGPTALHLKRELVRRSRSRLPSASRRA